MWTLQLPQKRCRTGGCDCRKTANQLGRVPISWEWSLSICLVVIVLLVADEHAMVAHERWEGDEWTCPCRRGSIHTRTQTPRFMLSIHLTDWPIYPYHCVLSLRQENGSSDRLKHKTLSILPCFYPSCHPQTTSSWDWTTVRWLRRSHELMNGLTRFSMSNRTVSYFSRPYFTTIRVVVR